MSNSEDEYDPSPSSPPYEKRASAANFSAGELKKGILSNVFSFVSREINEFVVNATGSTEVSIPRPVAGPSRERAGREQRLEERRGPQPSPSQRDVRAPNRIRRYKEDQRFANDLRRGRVVDVVDHDVCEPGEPTPASRSPPVLPARHARRSSGTMPGSLFSRSPTPGDDADARHVRFASGVVSPMPRRRRPISQREPEPPTQERHDEALEELGDDDVAGEDDEGEDEEGEDDEGEDDEGEGDEEEDGQGFHSHGGEDHEDHPAAWMSLSDHSQGNHLPSPSRPRQSSSNTLAGPSSRPHPATAFRPPAIRSVKDAIAKLDEDSPPRPITPNWHDQGKGKAREIEVITQEPQPSVDKGRGKEPVPLTTRPIERTHREDTLSRRNITDATLVEDPKGTSQAAQEAARRRIRELEEKVKILEDELARRPTLYHDPGVPPPPPPPPPLPCGPTSHIPLTSSPRHGSGVNSVLASVRAGLKQTASMPEKSKAVPKNRLPTVPADKMEAFLNELKTVKLRKVGRGDDLSQSTANTSSGQEQSQSSSQGGYMSEDRWAIGYKRKRIDSGNDVQITSMKRRFVVPSQPSTISTATSSTSTFLPPPPPSTLTHIRQLASVPVAPVEIDGTTPSLCSDNDNEIEDRAPSTPPLPLLGPGNSHMSSLDDNRQNARTITSEKVEVRVDREQHREREIRGLRVPSLNEKQLVPSSTSTSIWDNTLPSTSNGLTPERQKRRPPQVGDDPFSRRPPSSPMLPDTPRRPRPPARARSATKSATRPPLRNRCLSPSDNLNDGQLSLSFAPLNESTPAPNPVGKRRPVQRQESRIQRRMTLEEELHNAVPSYSDEERAVNDQDIQRLDPSYSDEERAVQELESGVLIGVGRRSKRLGFLAHGGAGGEPVLMGVGYVEGAVADEQELAHGGVKKPDTGKGKKKRGKSTAGGKRRPKR